ncbi:cellobiose phosphorylase [Candidatus Omnitrophota bacterium]
MKKAVKYHIDSNNEFIIENYNQAGNFSNFLPGIAGLFGKPMWAFYVNRAQCVCSFGIKSKDNPIMEFLPANRAYQLVSSQGFRTFIKIKSKKETTLYEPFRVNSEATQKMFISSHELRLKEVNHELGIEVEVTYFTIPGESFAGLARIVTLKNISKKDLKIELLDGAPLFIPYGVSNFFLQKMRRTVEAWMLVENLATRAPFYRLKVDPRDVSETSFISEGNFYLSTLSKHGKKPERLPVFVDPELIFGEINDFSYPANFVNEPGLKVSDSQASQNKLPCAMSLASFKLKKEGSSTLYSLIGHMSSKEKLNSMISRLTDKQFFIDKREENKAIIQELQDDVFTCSAENKYDLYCKQTFLDNVLRGGYPVNFGNSSPTFYVYSRKHGDLERDYNRFYVDPTYFSQGNGNFRDMNQNRRNDVFFNPDVGDSNIFNFYNLQQADGFNPLVLRGVKFRVKNNVLLRDAFKGKVDLNSIKKIEYILQNDFSPGEFFMTIEKAGIKLKRPWHEFLDELLRNCDAKYEATHGEGFWIDHWTYNLDLVESFLSVYPEKLKEILLDKKEFTFYDNSHFVKSHAEKSLLVGLGKVRQYHSLGRDLKKEHLIKKRHDDAYVMRSSKGEGKIYKTTLLVKMLCVIVNKIASIGPCGRGIEMEADKPGWCDSMNGLPGLFGTSTPEVFELKRQVVFILDSLKKLSLSPGVKIRLSGEIQDFMTNLELLIKASKSKKDFYYWSKANLLKEKYRNKIKLGFSGIEATFSILELERILKLFLSKVDSVIKKTYIPSQNVYATYFVNDVSKFKNLNKRDPVTELPLVEPMAFKSTRMPLFLEGNVRAMRVEKDIKRKKALYNAVKKTSLYDKKLNMYKLNGSLEGISKEVGRSSVFTPGWLENESIWLHMEYKYLLEILRAGLYKEFFEEFKNVLIPFQEPDVYGRSVFENSSFIVSSAFPDKKLHGRGFVARLSGSTAEMMTIWLLMNVGEKPFFLNNKGELCLKFSPVLPGCLFTQKAKNGFPKNSFAFKFLGKTTVVYHNPRRKNTAGANSVKIRFIIIKYDSGKKVEVKKGIIDAPYAQNIRDRKVERIDIYLG